MTPEDFEKLEGIIVKANQSGKKETSGLVAEIMHRMESGIEISINKNVNGKIKNLDEKIDNYIKLDTEWKVKYEPYFDSLVNISGTGKILVKIAIGIGAIIGTFVAIKELIK